MTTIATGNSTTVHVSGHFEGFLFDSLARRHAMTLPLGSRGYLLRVSRETSRLSIL
jgi:hypothetical protein